MKSIKSMVMKLNPNEEKIKEQVENLKDLVCGNMEEAAALKA